ncbi:FG-GAP repeat domain-containing protein [Actinomadura harenae]|nr:VCBS repeat-containing protein [Actinomadura harenae]
MRSIWRAGGVLAGAVAVVMACGTVASASVVGYGEPWEDCVQSVQISHNLGEVYANAATRCKSRHDFLVPTVALAGDQGKYGLEGKMKSCAWATFCETDNVYLDEIKGVDYRAANTGYVGSDPFMWPKSSIAHAQLTGDPYNKRLNNGAGTEAGTGRVRWADFDGDGRADYSNVSQDGAVDVYLNRGGDGHGGWDYRGRVHTSQTGISDSSRVRLADFDGDGRADYLVINPNGSVTTQLNRGGDGHGGWQNIGAVATGMTTDQNQVQFADFDEDGRADYNIVRDDGSITTWLNCGGDSSRQWEPIGRVAAGFGPGTGPRVRLAEMYNSQRFDYNVIGNGIPSAPGGGGPVGSVHTWINEGGDRNGHPGWGDWGQTATGIGIEDIRVVLADITGDGNADYLATNPDGSVHAYQNNGGDGHGGWTDLGNITTGH